jgi:hypothetical protein
MEPTVTITGARVDLDDGTTVAQIDAVTIGGGIRSSGRSTARRRNGQTRRCTGSTAGCCPRTG